MRKPLFWVIWSVAFGGFDLYQAVIHFGPDLSFAFYVLNTLVMWWGGTWWLHRPINRIPASKE